VRTVIIVIVLPLSQLLIEEVNIVGDAVIVQELIKRLVVHAMGSFHLPIQMRCSRADIHVADVERLEVPVEARLKLGTVPQMIRDEIKGIVDGFLSRSGLTREAIAAYILHPGGQKLLSYVEEQLGLCRCDTQLSWDVLSEYGNLSSATILFILHEWLTKKTMKSGDYGLAAAFGPGFSAEVLLLQWN
jgi:hypothetical protein